VVVVVAPSAVVVVVLRVVVEAHPSIQYPANKTIPIIDKTPNNLFFILPSLISSIIVPHT